MGHYYSVKYRKLTEYTFEIKMHNLGIDKNVSRQSLKNIPFRNN